MKVTKIATSTSTAVKVAVGTLLLSGAVAFGYGAASIARAKPDLTIQNMTLVDDPVEAGNFKYDLTYFNKSNSSVRPFAICFSAAQADGTFVPISVNEVTSPPFLQKTILGSMGVVFKKSVPAGMGIITGVIPKVFLSVNAITTINLKINCENSVDESDITNNHFKVVLPNIQTNITGFQVGGMPGSGGSQQGMIVKSDEKSGSGGEAGHKPPDLMPVTASYDSVTGKLSYDFINLGPGLVNKPFAIRAQFLDKSGVVIVKGLNVFPYTNSVFPNQTISEIKNITKNLKFAMIRLELDTDLAIVESDETNNLKDFPFSSVADRAVSGSTGSTEKIVEKPDLVVASASYDVKTGEVTFAIKNIGAGSVNKIVATKTTYINSVGEAKSLMETNMFSLLPGAIYNGSYNIKFFNTSQLKLIVDSTNVVAETSELNNELDFSIPPKN